MKKINGLHILNSGNSKLYQEVYNDINKAKLIESKLHKKFQMKKINGLHILNSGNSKLYSSDILNMDKEICSAAA